MADTQPGATSREDEIAKLAELMKDMRVCMFGTTDADGRPIARPMAVQEAEFGGDLWFFTKAGSRKAEQIGRDRRVNVTMSSSSSWISITGGAEIVRDPARAHELWNPGIEAWFPNGPDDPDVVLVRVTADGAEYWDTPGATAVTLLSFVKAKLTGQPHHIDDHKLSL